MGNLLRFLVLRFLPRRLVPVFLVWDVWQLWRNRHSRYYGQTGVARSDQPRRRKNTW